MSATILGGATPASLWSAASNTSSIRASAPRCWQASTTGIRTCRGRGPTDTSSAHASTSTSICTARAVCSTARLAGLVAAAVEVIERRLVLAGHLTVAAQVPSPHQIAEGVALRVVAVGAASLGGELFLLDEEL